MIALIQTLRALLACAPLVTSLVHADVTTRNDFTATGALEAPDLNEASGLEASRARPGHFFAINDSDRGALLYVLSGDGRHLARIGLEGAVNTDWEALASLPDPAHPDRRVLVIGDIGDNAGRREAITLWMLDEPRANDQGHYPESLPVKHGLTLRYPDGSRDAEALAWDPAEDRIVLMTKRDRPARIYSIPRADAFEKNEAMLSFDGALYPLRPPDADDARRFGRQAPWVSQPTGMDISADGREVAVITYRSIYRFGRPPGQPLHEALAAAPVEHLGPPGASEEALVYIPGAKAVLVASEGRGAPVYRADGAAVLPQTPAPER